MIPYKYLRKLIRVLVVIILVSLGCFFLFQSRFAPTSYWTIVILTIVLISLNYTFAIAFSLWYEKKYTPLTPRSIVIQLLSVYLSSFALSTIVIFIAFGVMASLEGKSFITGLLGIEFQTWIFFVFLYTLSVLVTSLGHFYKMWKTALIQQQTLQQEKVAFQYELLKSQVNPHFLFNSLNVLSSLILEKPEKAYEYTLKLSGIYRYILENLENELIELKEELKFCQAYFELQKLRLRGKIELLIDEDIPRNIYVLPISMQVLIENAIKHNAASEANKLRVMIKTKGEGILVHNNRLPKRKSEQSEGTGLLYLNKRLKHIFRKGFIVDESTESYSVWIPFAQEI